MIAQTRGRVAWTIAIVSQVLVVLAVLSTITQTDDVILVVTVVVATAAFGVVGATIASRTGNAVGWALLAVIGVTSLSLATEAYATVSLTRDAPPLPGTLFAAWVGTWTFFLALALIVTIPMLFPTGRPVWRWVWRMFQIATAVFVIGWAFLPQELATLSDEITGPQNPVGLRPAEGPVGAIVGLAGFAILFTAAAAIVGLVVRFRRAQGDERAQIKWLAAVGVASAAGLLANIVIGFALGSTAAPGWPSFVQNATFTVFVWIVLFGIPIACGIAVLKYRLWDIDVVIKKTLVALVLALLLGAISVAIAALVSQVALWQGTPRFVALGVGVVLGMLLLPLLRLSRRVADRIVYGKRATPYEVLATFASRVGDTYASDDVLPRMAQILQAGAGAASAQVLVEVGGRLQEGGRAGDPQGEEYVQPIVFQGDDVGALVVTFPANDPIDPQRTQLIAHLAAQAGPVVRNVRLIEELRASRQRLVAAQDDERRKIERNLHDGVQQQLVALNVQLGLLGRTAQRDPEKVPAIAEQLQGRATEALEDLRDLARGIYPPLLADQGLAAALEAQARKAAVPTTVSHDGIGRYDRAVESAVYFCSLEALNNVAKYAQATAATIELEQHDGILRFTVRDDGAGFDAGATAHGTGLQGMADRLDAIGGSIAVESSPGAGTTVVGSVPLMRPTT